MDNRTYNEEWTFKEEGKSRSYKSKSRTGQRDCWRSDLEVDSKTVSNESVKTRRYQGGSQVKSDICQKESLK